MDLFDSIAVGVFLSLPVWIFVSILLRKEPKLGFKRVGEYALTAELPTYKTEGAAGMDVYTPAAFTLMPGEIHVATTGLAADIPEGYELQIRPRSSLGLKGITVVNTPGTVDSDYRGEIGVILINHSKTAYVAKAGERIAQFVLARTVYLKPQWVEELSETKRGAGGFGSTGR